MHDVYDNNFQLLWSNHEITETNETELLQHCEEDLDELDVVLEEYLVINNKKNMVCL